MACTKEPWLLMRFLNDQLNETKVRRTDGITGLNEAVNSAYGTSIIWTFVKDKWDILNNR